MEIEDLIEAIQAGRIFTSRHSLAEAANDDLVLGEVYLSVVEGGEMIEEYPTAYPSPACLILGFNTFGDPIHSVWSYDRIKSHCSSRYRLPTRSEPLDKLEHPKMTLESLQAWAQSQINNTAQPEVRPDIGASVLQLVDEVEQVATVRSRARSKIAHSGEIRFLSDFMGNGLHSSFNLSSLRCVCWYSPVLSVSKFKVRC